MFGVSFPKFRQPTIWGVFSTSDGDNVIYIVTYMYHSTVVSLILIDQKMLFKQLRQSCQLQNKAQA